MQKLFLTMQNIDQVMGHEHESYLKYKKEDYKLTEESTFIDIGSGFGKPVFHGAMLAGCYSKGVEIVPARVEFWIDFVFEYETKNKDIIAKIDAASEKEEQAKIQEKLTPNKSLLKQMNKHTYSCNPLAVDSDHKNKGKYF